MYKKNKGHVAATVFGYLVLLTIILCMIFLIIKWVGEDKRDSVAELPVNAGAQVVSEEDILKTQQVTLMREELDSMLKEASAVARAEATDRARGEVLEDIRARLETGDESTVEVLRSFYPDDIVLVSGGKFHFVPVNRQLKMNSYSADNLNILESGEYQYLENGQVISHKGIDVSSYQGKIDWKSVAADGVEFAFIRVAYRGYGSGKMVEDDQFDRNIKGALAAGIHVGAYIVTQAVDETEAVEEANLVISKLKANKVTCPIVFDVERAAKPTGRMDQLTMEERTNVTAAFCKAVEDAGYTPIIYHNMEMGTLMIDIEPLEQYGKWFAYYNSDMYYPYDYMIWQYSDKGSVKGIKGDVDLDLCFGTFWE